MREMAGSGMTMVVVTHEIGFAREADRVVFMTEGAITVEAAPREFFAAAADPRLASFLSKVL
jgi:ABC-type polar amino acid transport system ATPase subunit